MLIVELVFYQSAVFACIFALIVVVLLAPVQHPDHRLSFSHRIKMRKRALLYVLIEGLLIASMYFRFTDYVKAASLGLFSASLLAITGHLKYLKEEDDDGETAQ